MWRRENPVSLALLVWRGITAGKPSVSLTTQQQRRQHWVLTEDRHRRCDLRRVLAVFTRSAITPPKVNWFGWNLEHSENTVGGWLRQILGAIRAVAAAGEPGEFFLSGKQRSILAISRRPNYTKFEHNTSIGVAMKTFETEFRKFYRKGSFFFKKVKAKISLKFLTFCDFRPS